MKTIYGAKYMGLAALLALGADVGTAMATAPQKSESDGKTITAGFTAGGGKGSRSTPSFTGTAVGVGNSGGGRRNASSTPTMNSTILGMSQPPSSSAKSGLGASRMGGSAPTMTGTILGATAGAPSLSRMGSNGIGASGTQKELVLTQKCAGGTCHRVWVDRDETLR